MHANLSALTLGELGEITGSMANLNLIITMLGGNPDAIAAVPTPGALEPRAQT